MNKNILIEPDNIFGDYYNQWRLLRVCKLEQIFGIDWFKGKKILELGCGYGNIGLYLQNLGAEMTFADARTDFLDVIKGKCQTAKIICLNQNKKWNFDEQYDLIIHFGVLYNIQNWQQDLQCALSQTKYLALETAVNRYSYDINFAIKNFDLNGKHCGIFEQYGSLPSVNLIEKELGKTFKRYDDADLNGNDFIKYTLICNDDAKVTSKTIDSWHNKHYYGGRKFWIVDTKSQ